MKINDEFPALKKESLNKKLIMYSVAAGMTLSLGAKAHAEIQYTNIEPNKTITQAENHETHDFLLDLNNDGTPEFKYSRHSQPPIHFHILTILFI